MYFTYKSSEHFFIIFFYVLISTCYYVLSHKNWENHWNVQQKFIHISFLQARACACVRACVRVCVCVFLCKQSDYFKVVILFTGEESNSTVCKSSPMVPTTSSPTSVWMAMRSIVLLALTNLTAYHFLPHNSVYWENPRRTTVHPGERPSFFEIKTLCFLLKPFSS